MNSRELTMREHEALRGRLSALLDGALSPRETSEVEAHLEQCAACRSELEGLRATVQLLREVEPVQAPDGFAAAVRGRIGQIAVGPGAVEGWRAQWQRARDAAARRFRRPAIRWSWKTAAAAASVVLVGVFAMNLLREAVPPPRAPVADRDGGSRPTGEEGGGKSVFGVRERPQAAPRYRSAAPPQSDARTAQAPPAAVEPSIGRRVIRTGEVALEVEKFDEAARSLLQIAEGAGGFIAESATSEENGVPRGTFVVRVPARRFAGVIGQIEQLGTVQRRRVSGQDVTEEFVDLDARIRNLERHEARLLSFMDRATKISDLMAIEQEAARVRGEIEQLTGRRRFLSDRVDLGTVSVSARERPKKQPGGLWDFDRTIGRIQAAFVGTVRQMLRVAEGLAAFTASLAPVALLGVFGWLIARRSLRRADRLI